MSQLTPGSRFSAPPRPHRVPKLCSATLQQPPAITSSSSQLSPPGQEGREEITPLPNALSPPRHPTSMTEAVQMPLESGCTQLPSSSVGRTKGCALHLPPRAPVATSECLLKALLKASSRVGVCWSQDHSAPRSARLGGCSHPG